MGETITKINTTGIGDNTIEFECASGYLFRMLHEQDCCESVTIDDIVGNLDDLIGSPVTLAEESTSDNNNSDKHGPQDEYDESYTWTFYRLATVKGFVDIKWYGTSNGYYSESVSFLRISEEVKARELRVGNLIFDEYRRMEEVYEISYDGSLLLGSNLRKQQLHNCAPILITKEILLKCGFSHDIEVDEDYREEHRFVSGDIIFRDGMTGTDCVTHSNIEYLHQLQNLTFALTGEELKVNL